MLNTNWNFTGHSNRTEFVHEPSFVGGSYLWDWVRHGKLSTDEL